MCFFQGTCWICWMFRGLIGRGWEGPESPLKIQHSQLLQHFPWKKHIVTQHDKQGSNIFNISAARNNSRKDEGGVGVWGGGGQVGGCVGGSRGGLSKPIFWRPTPPQKREGVGARNVSWILVPKTHPPPPQKNACWALRHIAMHHIGSSKRKRGPGKTKHPLSKIWNPQAPFQTEDAFKILFAIGGTFQQGSCLQLNFLVCCCFGALFAFNWSSFYLQLSFLACQWEMSSNKHLLLDGL